MDELCGAVELVDVPVVVVMRPSECGKSVKFYKNFVVFRTECKFWK